MTNTDKDLLERAAPDFVANAVRCRICGAAADRRGQMFQCQAHPGHIADTMTGIFSDHTTKILPVNPAIADIWRAKAEAPPGPGVQALMNLIAEDCVETTTEHIDGNTLVQKICIKDTGRLSQMAREAGFDAYDDSCLAAKSDLDEVAAVSEYPIGEALARFERIVVEACAKVAQGYQDPCTGKAIADEIREHFGKEG